MLRSHEACAREHTGIQTCRSSRAPSFLLALASVVFLAITAPAAPAAPGDPKQAAPPQELWNAFPLNPKVQRLVPERQQAGPKAPFTPPGRRQTAAASPSEASRNDLPLLAVAGGGGALILLALLGLAAVHVRHVAGHRRRSAPLWQGTAGIEAGPVARLQQYADVDAPLTRPSRPVSRSVVPLDGRHRRRGLQTLRNPNAITHWLRDAIWNETTAPVIVGAALAVAVAFLIVHYGG